MKITATVTTISFLGALMLLVAGPGTRFGLWDFGTGFMLMRVAFFAGLAAAAIATLLLIVPRTRKGGAGFLMLAVVVGLATAWLPWNAYRTAMSLPFIHDITTDIEHPPEFVDIVPLRADAPNPPEYAGAEVGEQQREAYPDIQTLEFSQSADDTFEDALEVAKSMGWYIVAAEPEAGRIEATATTFWFGFTDDVVIRIEPAAAGSRLDIRSKSRVGQSDIGKNAERIRDFLDAIEGWRT